MIDDKSLAGMYVRDVIILIKNTIEVFNQKGFFMVYKTELDEIVSKVDNSIYLKKEFLDCVMYRIIERGGNIYGPRRGFLFAKEFERDIVIPINYDISLSDLSLKEIVLEHFSDDIDENVKVKGSYQKTKQITKK